MPCVPIVIAVGDRDRVELHRRAARRAHALLDVLGQARRWKLQGIASIQVLAIPMVGRREVVVVEADPLHVGAGEGALGPVEDGGAALPHAVAIGGWVGQAGTSGVRSARQRRSVSRSRRTMAGSSWRPGTSMLAAADQHVLVGAQRRSTSRARRRRRAAARRHPRRRVAESGRSTRSAARPPRRRRPPPADADRPGSRSGPRRRARRRRSRAPRTSRPPRVPRSSAAARARAAPPALARGRGRSRCSLPLPAGRRSRARPPAGPRRSRAPASPRGAPLRPRRARLPTSRARAGGGTPRPGALVLGQLGVALGEQHVAAGGSHAQKLHGASIADAVRQLGPRRRAARSRASTGPAPSPTSRRPLPTASEAISRALRAASISVVPRAR